MKFFSKVMITSVMVVLPLISAYSGSQLVAREEGWQGHSYEQNGYHPQQNGYHPQQNQYHGSYEGNGGAAARGYEHGYNRSSENEENNQAPVYVVPDQNNTGDPLYVPE